MTSYSGLDSSSGQAAAVRSILRDLLAKGVAESVLVAARNPYSNLPMPTLISNPDQMSAAAPLSPVAPFNTARQASKLCRTKTEKKLALVLRPCEVRALIELVKLNQADLENALIISFDCSGRLENDLFLEKSDGSGSLTEAMFKDDSLMDQAATACLICTDNQPQQADLNIRALGGKLGISAQTSKGEEALSALGLTPEKQPEDHDAAAGKILEKRKATRLDRLAGIRDKTKDIEGLEKILANCLNCYNCRTACPVCYCRECVFLTDVFAHEPEVYFRRAERRGVVKMPTDTTMFHLTRLAHMSHACVGCGQCSSVCPSSIPVADIFTAAAEKVQELFDYKPGLDPAQPVPYLVFGQD